MFIKVLTSASQQHFIKGNKQRQAAWETLMCAAASGSAKEQRQNYTGRVCSIKSLFRRRVQVHTLTYLTRKLALLLMSANELAATHETELLACGLLELNLSVARCAMSTHPCSNSFSYKL